MSLNEHKGRMGNGIHGFGAASTQQYAPATQAVLTYIEDQVKGRQGHEQGIAIDTDGLHDFITDLNKGRQGSDRNASLDTTAVAEFVEELIENSAKGRLGSNRTIEHSALDAE